LHTFRSICTTSRACSGLGTGSVCALWRMPMNRQQSGHSGQGLIPKHLLCLASGCPLLQCTSNVQPRRDPRVSFKAWVFAAPCGFRQPRVRSAVLRSSAVSFSGSTVSMLSGDMRALWHRLRSCGIVKDSRLSVFPRPLVCGLVLRAVLYATASVTFSSVTTEQHSLIQFW
jgi:hypothetical protein